MIDLEQTSTSLTKNRSPLGCLLLTGSRVPFHLQPQKQREEIILRWRFSYLSALANLCPTLTVLCGKIWLSTSDLHSKLIGFPKFPAQSQRNPGFDFEFLNFDSGDEMVSIDTDVVIVGSGCGGGVCAKNLAEAGVRVLLVDKGYHFSTLHFPMDIRDAESNLFDGGAQMVSDDGSTITMPGSCWGGGGVVNWSASLHLQNWVREEWARESGISFFTSQAFQTSLDRVAHRMGVSSKHINHNKPNRILIEGARRLGLPYADVPQNTGNSTHDCGYCHVGCASATKQSPAISFLPDTARAGARFMQGFTVDRVLFDSPKSKGRATGIRGTWTSVDRSINRQVKINAKKVIISAGTMNSPLILQRSGLRNPQIGRNLLLHPCALIQARYEEEIRAWEGSILTSLVDLGHVKLETVVMLPFIGAAMTPWKGGLDFKTKVSSFNHWAAFIALTRDQDSGRVYADPVDGQSRFSYTSSRSDTKHTLDAVITGLKIHYIMGAKELASPNPFLNNFIRAEESGDPEDGVNDEAFQAWLKELRRLGLASPNPCARVSAHQMGTCRMSSSADTGVVDSKGRVWGTDGLYVADASVFPSASGVNPMLTTMGLCDWISRNIAKEMKAEK